MANVIREFKLDSNYVDDDEPWKVILMEAYFYIFATFHTNTKTSKGQLFFGQYIIVPNKHTWKSISQYK